MDNEENKSTETPKEPKKEVKEVKPSTFLPKYKGEAYIFGRKNANQAFTIVKKSLSAIHEKRKTQTVETLEEALKLTPQDKKAETQRAFDAFSAAATNKKCLTC